MVHFSEGSLAGIISSRIHRTVGTTVDSNGYSGVSGTSGGIFPVSRNSVFGGTTVDSNGYSGVSGKFPQSAAAALRSLLPGRSDSSDSFVNPQASNSASGSSPSTPQQLVYQDAPLAETYGMDASTAYHEALANTAYQRKVRDLKAAGLNPVLGISGSGADSFYGVPLQSSDGGSSGSYGSAKSTSDLSNTASKLSYGLPYLANAIVNLGVTAATKNSKTGYGAGMIAQNAVSGALNLLRNFG